MDNFIDDYTNYLISSITYTTATGLAKILDISHDKVTRALSKCDLDGNTVLWYAKKYIDETTHSKEYITLTIDDTVQEKRYTNENNLICYHFDHTVGRSVKGVNFLSALVQVGDMRIPTAVEFVKKDKIVEDPKTGKVKKVSQKTKNTMFLGMVGQCLDKFRFDCVLTDCWFASKDNMRVLKMDLGLDFVMALKSNRVVSIGGRGRKDYVRIDSLDLGIEAVDVWLKGIDFPLSVTKQVFKNEGGTVGELYLVCSERGLTYETINARYQKRWGIEEYHKSIKSITALAKSPTKTIKTQMNHFILSIIAYIKMEFVKLRTKKNHFAMKNKIYEAAQKLAYNEFKKLSTKT